MRMKQFNSKVGNMKIQICMTVNIQNVYYLDELCDWVNAAQFYDEYFNMLHDPKHMCISNLTPEAKELVINKLKTARFSPRHKLEIVRIIKFLENGSGSDGADFANKNLVTLILRLLGQWECNELLLFTAVQLCACYGKWHSGSMLCVSTNTSRVTPDLL